VEGLNVLAQEMARQCDISFGNRAVHVDVRDKVVCFDDGSDVGYETLVSTLPLNRMIEMTNLTPEEEPDPCTSVLVINIGAERGLLCPDDHWLYVPKSRAGFHRVGFYSNVDASFLPASSRENQDRVSIYVERAYLQGQEPIPDEVQALCDEVVKELQDWAWIQETEAVDPTWVDVAYTWTWPDSKYKQEAMKALESRNIYQVGRYARWKFQGIADSIGDGMMAGAAISIN
jgi:protoporphyrinogen oxidase